MKLGNERKGPEIENRTGPFFFFVNLGSAGITLVHNPRIVVEKFYCSIADTSLRHFGLTFFSE